MKWLLTSTLLLAMAFSTEERQTIFHHLQNSIKMVQEQAAKRNWTVKPLEMGKPASDAELQKLEKSLGRKLSQDHKDLFKLASSFYFEVFFDDDEPPKPFDGNFSGQVTWNMNTLVSDNRDFRESWDQLYSLEFIDQEDRNEAERFWQHHVPFTTIADGDYITINEVSGELYFFSNDDIELHGKRLFKSIWDFLRFQTNTGTVGLESWQLGSFYNNELKLIEVDSDLVRKYRDWTDR